jgi:hypothetical protein
MEGERQSDGGARLLGITTEYLGAPAPDMQRQLRHPEASNAEMKAALAQSGERIHGKENPGAILLGR